MKFKWLKIYPTFRVLKITGMIDDLYSSNYTSI